MFCGCSFLPGTDLWPDSLFRARLVHPKYHVTGLMSHQKLIFLCHDAKVFSY